MNERTNEQKVSSMAYTRGDVFDVILGQIAR
jgi:hypothetical protein